MRVSRPPRVSRPSVKAPATVPAVLLHLPSPMAALVPSHKADDAWESRKLATNVKDAGCRPNVRPRKGPIASTAQLPAVVPRPPGVYCSWKWSLAALALYGAQARARQPLGASATALCPGPPALQPDARPREVSRVTCWEYIRSNRAATAVSCHLHQPTANAPTNMHQASGLGPASP